NLARPIILSNKMDITEILFSILAIVSGIITTATFTIFTIFLLSKLFPNSYGTKVKTPSLFWVLLNLFYSCLFAILGGFVCGIIAGRGKEIIHSLVLGGVMIIGSIAEMVIPEKN